MNAGYGWWVPDGVKLAVRQGVAVTKVVKHRNPLPKIVAFALGAASMAVLLSVLW